MADSYIQIPADGIGKKVRSYTNTIGSDEVHTHYFIAADEAGNSGELAKLHDLDSGAGTELNLGVTLREAASGGSTAIGVPANPLEVSLENTGTNTNNLRVDIFAASAQVGVDVQQQNLFSLFVGGDHAHDADDTTFYSYPIKIGGKALTSRQTAVSNNDRSDAYFDEYGRLITANDYEQRSDTYTATANGTTVTTTRLPLSYFTIQTVATGGVTSWTILLEGSLDGTNFFTILTASNATPAISTTAAWPVRYFRSRCSAIVLGGGTNVIAYILGVPS